MSSRLFEPGQKLNQKRPVLKGYIVCIEGNKTNAMFEERKRISTRRSKATTDIEKCRENGFHKFMCEREIS